MRLLSRAHALLFEGPVELTRLESLLLRVGSKSCRSCGYLSQRLLTYEGHSSKDAEHSEVPIVVRQSWSLGTSTQGIRVAHCFRGLWHNNTLGDEALAQTRNISKPRFCGSSYPYSEDTPQEHRSSHRARTNRRWLVLGGLLGPYVATVVGFSASQISVKGALDGGFILGIVAGAVALSTLAIVINLVLMRRG